MNKKLPRRGEWNKSACALRSSMMQVQIAIPSLVLRTKRSSSFLERDEYLSSRARGSRSFTAERNVTKQRDTSHIAETNDSSSRCSWNMQREASDICHCLRRLEESLVGLSDRANIGAPPGISRNSRGNIAANRERNLHSSLLECPRNARAAVANEPRRREERPFSETPRHYVRGKAQP